MNSVASRMATAITSITETEACLRKQRLDLQNSNTTQQNKAVTLDKPSLKTKCLILKEQLGLRNQQMYPHRLHV